MKNISYAVICIQTGLFDGWYGSEDYPKYMIEHKGYYGNMKQPVLCKVMESLALPIPECLFHTEEEEPTKEDEVYRIYLKGLAAYQLLKGK